MPDKIPASASHVVALFQESSSAHNILTFDFHDQAAVAALPWEGADAEAGLRELKALQRLMRLHPNWEIARALLAAGLGSAHAIAAMPEERFVQRQRAGLRDDPALARAIHHKAVDVKQRAALLWANVKDMVAAPHYRATLFNNVPNALVDFYRGLPSYQDLFGSLDYCECEECRSILSPAAYFVDLMRLVEQYVTTGNIKSIPPGMTLQARRPDLFRIPLDCEHTNTLVPYLQIVNTVMESKLTADLGTDAFKHLATSHYPFNQPFHLPLAQIRSFLAQFKTELATIYELLKVDAQQVHREQLQLSIEAYELISTPRPDPAALSADYGVHIHKDLGGLDRAETFARQTGLSPQQLHDLLYQNLGQQEILDVAGSYTMSREATFMLTLQQAGRQVQGHYASIDDRGSLAGTIEGQTFTGTWTDGATPSAGNVELTFATDGASFSGRWRRGFSGPWQAGAWSGTRTGTASTSGMIPHSFFINQGFAEPHTYLGLQIDTRDPQKPFERITNLDPDALDRLNRFIRLANTLQWSFADLDWVLKSIGAAQIDTQALTNIAGVKQLQLALGLPLDVLCSFWHDMPTIGAGDGTVAQDLFDRVFNQPTVFYNLDKQKNAQPYHPGDLNDTPYQGNPLYTDQPLAWDPDPAVSTQAPGATEQPNTNALLRSRLLAALSLDDDELTGLANHLLARGQVSTTNRNIPLTVPNLSQLYRFSKLASALGLNIGEYLLLLELLPKQADTINYPGRAIQGVLAVVKLAEWLKTSGLNVYQLHYITTGQPNPFVDPGYLAGDVRPMLAELWQQSQAWLAQPTAFIHDNMDAAQSEAIFRQLAAHRLIDRRGVLLDQPITFQALATLTRLTGTSFVTDLIDATASQTAVFDPLRKKKIINSHHFLASSFNDATDLSFLFPGDPQQADKIEQVSAFLLQIRALSSSGIAVQDNSFVTAGIDQQSSQHIFAQLVKSNIVDQNGFFVDGLRLFSADSQFNAELNQGKLPERLRQLFAEQAHEQLSNETVVVVGLKGRRWLIVDPQRHQEYTLKYEKKQLNVYGSFSRDTNLSFLLQDLDTPPVIPIVQAILLRARQNITFIWGVLEHLLKLQKQGIVATLASFFDAETTLLQAVLDIAITLTGQPNDLALLLSPFAETTQIPARLQALLAAIARIRFLADQLGLTAAELQSMREHPEAYGLAPIKPGFTFSVANVETLYTFRQLVAAFDDTDNQLIGYFAMPPATSGGSDAKIKALAALTGWDHGQISLLATTFLPGEQASTVAGVAWLKQVFDLAGHLGVDAYFLQRLTGISALPAAGAGNWPTYQATAQSLLDIVNARYNAAEWQAIYRPIADEINERKRDALLGYTVWHLDSSHPKLQIKTPRDLYQFLLIDVEIGGCADTSYIRQGLDSLQLYIQRVRMDLEVGIERLGIRDIWWEWMGNYRIWEANRKVFLYPENYLDPSLRKTTKTPLFRALEDELLQSEISAESVTTAYLNYLDTFAQLARLKIAGSYYCKAPRITILGEEEHADTLFLFGRSDTTPYTYYYRKATIDPPGGPSATDKPIYNIKAWTPWEQIDLAINAKYVTPAYAFDKLFIFWVEITKQPSGQNNQATAYIATIKYSFYNFSKRWIQPQTLADGIVIDYDPDTYPAKLKTYVPNANLDIDPEHVFWNKVYALNIPEQVSHPETLLVVFGDLPSLTKAIIDNLPAVPNDLTAEETTFDTMLHEAIRRAVTAGNKGVSGYATLAPATTLSDSLMVDDTHVIIEDSNFGFLTPYRGQIAGNDSAAALNVIPTDNLLYDNDLGDTNRANNMPTLGQPQQLLLANVSPRNAAITMVKNQPGWFTFDNGDESFLVAAQDPGLKQISDIITVGHNEMNTSGETNLSTGRFTNWEPGDTGLVSHWPLDGNTNDTIGNHNGSAIDVQWIQVSDFPPANGVFRSVAAFNGRSTNISVAYSAALNPASFTIEVWVKFAGNIGDDRVVLQSGDRAAGHFRGYGLGAFRGKWICIAGNGTDFIANLEGTAVTTEQWTHLASSYDAATQLLCFYVNGYEVNRKVFAYAPTPEGAFLIGVPVSPAQPSDHWVGQITSLRVWNRVVPPQLPTLSFAFTRLSSNSIQLLSRALFAGGVDQLLSIQSQLAPELPFSRFQPSGAAIPPASESLDFGGANGLYFWEIFFYIPFLIANSLSANRRFAEAQQWYHYIFNPTAKLDDIGLAADWPLDDGTGTTVHDRAGDPPGSHNGTIVGAAHWDTVRDFPLAQGQPRAVLAFDGKSAVSVPFDPALNPASFTIEIWAKVTGGDNSYRGVVTSRDDTIFPVKGYGFYAANNNRWSFYIGPGSGAWSGLTGPEVANNQWTHLAGSYDATLQLMRFYVDGREVASTMTTFAPKTQGPLYIGASTGDSSQNPNYYFVGQLAGVRVWDTARSPEQIRFDYRLDFQHPADRFWGFLPFRGITPCSLAGILTDPQQIARYNDDPFDPDAIARLRITAFQKAVVMKYIDNLLQWGDALFTQDTWESITQATMLYVMAQDLLGDRPQPAAMATPPPPATFQDILNRYGDDIPQFLIDLENVLPPVADAIRLAGKPYNEVESYFCVAENPDFTAYWDRADDRLYKIRHCLNLQGVARQLALFEPPINPMALIRAAAAGKDIASVVAQLLPAVPHYRFDQLLERARNVTATLVQLGSTLLGTLEKQDAEQLALLRTSQEQALLKLTTNMKEQQIEEATATLESLSQSLAAAQYRKSWYQSMLAGGLSAYEQINEYLMIASLPLQLTASSLRFAALAPYLLPNIYGVAAGGMKFGDAVSTAAAGLDTMAGWLNQQASLAATQGQFARRAEEWQMQQQLADYDMQQIDGQITAANARLAIAARDLQVHTKSIAQAQEMEDFLKRKFTSQELYRWMAGRIAAVYFQTYNVAFDLALAAQKAYQYELDSEATYIDFGYWDSLKKGLVAGEMLMLSLNQLEKAYLDTNVRRLEIEKTISLLQLNPKALLDLKTTGACYFELSEKLFDLDFPGHYARKIKTIAISLPAVVGPYQNIQATLIQHNNRVVLHPDLNAVNFLLGGANAADPDPRILRSNWRANQQIALSKGIDDDGLFDLSFSSDQRYLPFEGTGAVSSWELQLPKATNTINFESISDVIIRLQYTALPGGTAFADGIKKLPGMKSVSGYRAFSLSSTFSAAWYAFLHPEGDNPPKLEFAISEAMFPGNLEKLKLTAIFMQLDATTTIPITLTLTVPSSQKVDLPFANNIASKQLKGVEKFYGQWSATVTAGTLNPQQMRNIVLILTYDGDLKWNG